MSVLDALRTGIAAANAITMPLQVDVAHEAFVGSTGTGAKTYATAVSRPAIVEWKTLQVAGPTGVLTVSKASITFLDPAVIIGAQDRLTLPDGRTGPIAVAGPLDGETGRPLVTEVTLG